MPNWCLTQYNVINGNENVLETLLKEFTEATKINTVQNAYGEKWLGNVMLHLGLTEDEMQKTRCRGTVECDQTIDFDEETGLYELHIFSETAWEPMPDAILRMVEKFAPDSKITYLSETPMSEVYITNIPDLVGSIYGGNVSDEDEACDETEEEKIWQFMPLEDL